MIGSIISKRAITNAYDALSQHDMEAFLKDWRDDAVFIYPGDIAVSGTHTGKEAIRAWFQSMMEQYPKIDFTLQNVAVSNVFDLVGNNVIIVEWDLQATNKDGYSAENSGITVIKTRWGKGLHVKDYIFNTGETWRKAWGFE